MSFIKTGGIASEFLKADGSVDINTYLEDNFEVITTGLDTNFKSITLNSVSFGAVYNQWEFKIYAMGGYAYGCSLYGVLIRASHFNNSMESIKTSAPIISSAANRPSYPVLLMYENAILNSKNNQSSHVYIGTDGYLYSEGANYSLITNSPYDNSTSSSVYTKFYGNWFITPYRV